MRRTRRCGGKGRRSLSTNEAVIKIIGAPSIVPVSFTAVARKDQTWYQFLAKNGLKLTPSDGIRVRTSGNSVTFGKRGCWLEFYAELDEKIGTFLGKYKYKNMKKFTVRLMFKRKTITFQPPAGNVARRQSQRNRRTSTGCGGGDAAWNLSALEGTGGCGRRISPREAKLASRQFVGRLDSVEGEEKGGANGEVVVDQAVKLESDEGAMNDLLEDVGEGEVPQLEEEEEEDDNDNMSVMTSASQDARDLRRKGIRNEDLKNPAMGRFVKIENGYLLRVRQEIKRLKKKNLWIGNFQRAPLASYLLEQILNT